ncbi:MAG: transcription termination/antitermination protein NusA [Pelagibacterales bacterium]|nr:transcription termination/antitermination protein NusA [Pelagibacterales bacterium]
MLNKRADKLELIRIAEAVALEKSIDRELIINSMETGIAKAAKSKFGQENEIAVQIDRENGNIDIFRKLIVVEKPENINTEISVKDAQNLSGENKDKKIGDEILQILPSFDFGRIAAQTAKQIISFNVREAERERQFNDFVDKKDTVLSGIIKRLEFGNVIVDLGKAEAIIQKNEMIPRENIKAGDRIKAYCLDVRREPKGQQIFLSRAHPKFMEKLFFQEVPEIYDGLIEIKSSARDPGSRAKIGVQAIDTSLDPVGACVGMRGSRVQAVVNELQGEKIDIVNWSEDPAVIVSNALSPAEVQRVNVDLENKKLDVILTEENLSKAIGRRGQNVRLATKLMNYEINIMTDQEDSEKRQSEFKEKTENFVKNLELDETLGQLLVAEGFASIDDIKDSTIEALVKIEGIEEDTAKELIGRAKEFYQKDQEEISNKIKDLGLDNDLINHEGLTLGMLVTLGEQKILSLTDFADLASDELTGVYDVIKGERVKIKGYLEDFALSKNEADELIMSARNKIYQD